MYRPAREGRLFEHLFIQDYRPNIFTFADSEAPQEISAKSNKSPDSAGDLAIAGGLGNLMTSYGELSDSDQEASKTTGRLLFHTS